MPLNQDAAKPQSMPQDTDTASSSSASDIQQAAEALQRLRSSSQQPLASTLPAIQLPPISSEPFFNTHRSSKVSSSYHSYSARHSPYHSRSSSFSSASFAPPNISTSAYNSPAASPPVVSSALASPVADSPAAFPQPNGQIHLPSIDSAILLSNDPSSDAPKSANKRKFTPGFLNPLVSSAAKIYEQSKSYSPRFRYSAEKIESVISSRMNANSPNGIKKLGAGSQKTTLPPIRAFGKPSPRLDYQEDEDNSPQQPPVKKRQRSTWQGMLVTASSIATSFSYENKQRLRYCLHLLKLANTHIAAKVNQLQEILQEERAAALAQSIAANHVPSAPDANPNNTSARSNRANSNAFLSQKVNTIKRDIVWTIRKVVSALSTYAGNSLPEPARTHVRNYILRLPARWASTLSVSNSGSGASTRCSTPAPHSGANTPTIDSLLSPVHTNSTTETNTHLKDNSPASSRTETTLFSPNVPSSPLLSANNGNLTPSTSADSSASQSYTTTTLNNEERLRIHTDAEIGNRVLTLATEALEMLGSIINIVDETLERAEIWCDRFGRVGITSGQNRQQAQAAGQPDEGQASSTSLDGPSAEDSTAGLKQRSVPGPFPGANLAVEKSERDIEMT